MGVLGIASDVPSEGSGDGSATGSHSGGTTRRSMLTKERIGALNIAQTRVASNNHSKAEVKNSLGSGKKDRNIVHPPLLRLARQWGRSPNIYVFGAVLCKRCTRLRADGN